MRQNEFSKKKLSKIFKKLSFKIFKTSDLWNLYFISLNRVKKACLWQITSLKLISTENEDVFVRNSTQKWLHDRLGCSSWSPQKMKMVLSQIGTKSDTLINKNVQVDLHRKCRCFYQKKYPKVIIWKIRGSKMISIENEGIFITNSTQKWLHDRLGCPSWSPQKMKMVLSQTVPKTDSMID